MRITELPVELYFVIRDFLICYPLEVDVDPFNRIEHYFRQENNRSWRNFLSVRSDLDWELIRKKTIIWSLNKYESEKYLNDPLFQQSLHKKITISDQLRCNMCCASNNSFSIGPLNTAMLGHLYIKSYQGNWLSSCSSLFALTLKNCGNLKKLGDYENLKSLRVANCNNVKSIGQHQRLSDLRVSEVSEKFISVVKQLKILSFKRMLSCLMLLKQFIHLFSLAISVHHCFRSGTLSNTNTYSDGREHLDLINKFLIQESFWSWRNFLSVRNDAKQLEINSKESKTLDVKSI
jgi:hypothetical protein